MHGHVTVRYLQYRTVDRRHVHSAYDNDECHVTAFRPISEAAHSWSYDNLTCRWTWKLDSNDVALSWLRASKMTQDLNSTRLPDQSALNFTNHELLSARIGITASSATAQSQVNRITTGTSKVNVSRNRKFPCQIQLDLFCCFDRSLIYDRQTDAGP